MIYTEVPVKTCSKCKASLSLINFNKAKRTHDGFCFHCKDCMRIYANNIKDTPASRARSLVKNATRRNPSCSLSTEDIKKRIGHGYCEVTGIKFDLSGGHTTDDGKTTARSFTPSLDRKDPTKGYTQDNVQVVVWIYNRAKGVQGHADVMTMVKALVANHVQ